MLDTDWHRGLFRATYYTLRHWEFVNRTEIFADGMPLAWARDQAGLPGRICVEQTHTRVPLFSIQHPGLMRLLTYDVQGEPEGLYLGTVVFSAFGERAVQLKWGEEVVATLHNTGISRESCALMLRGMSESDTVRAPGGREIGRMQHYPGWLALLYTTSYLEYYSAEGREQLDPRLLIAARLVQLHRSSSAD